MPARTPLDEFIDRLVKRTTRDASGHPYPRHVHATEDNLASIKHLKRGAKCERSITFRRRLEDGQPWEPRKGRPRKPSRAKRDVYMAMGGEEGMLVTKCRQM